MSERWGFLNRNQRTSKPEFTHMGICPSVGTPYALYFSCKGELIHIMKKKGEQKK